MPVTQYRYSGTVLAQAQSIWNVQKQNMGMLELNLDQLIPGAKEVLILSIQQFNVPGRTVGSGDLHYLNGVSKYATKPEAQGNISVTFRDFPDPGARRVLYQWFSLVFNEDTGLMLPMGLVKTTGNLVLFASDGTSERTARLEGLWPTKMPDVGIDFGSGEVMTMEIELSCDRVIWDQNLLAPVNPAG
ncbi:MAG TPA: hypothetical protein VMY39_05340 [Planctomycetota bacterium]|nr:hypothetical protein [Planctomycetota bacterium]